MGVVVASVMGLLEARETAARVRVEELRAEAERVSTALREAEAVLERRVIAVAELAEALDGPACTEDAESAVPGPAVVKAVVQGSVVPYRREGVAAEVLAADYRRIVVLVDQAGPAGSRVKDLARGLGLDMVPGKLEGVRSKAKRLVARGWLAEQVPGVFTPRLGDGSRRRGGPDGGS